MLNSFEVYKEWTLFLDRDGVINEKRENDYVKNWKEFCFINKSLVAISRLSDIFGRIIVVTNQRGVGKGLFSEIDLISIHESMVKEIEFNSGKIDKVYYCTDVSEFAICRKPNTGMAFKALSDFPEIDFNKSYMVGDSDTDLMFAQKLGMKKILIGDKDYKIDVDGKFSSLFEFSLNFKY